MTTNSVELFNKYGILNSPVEDAVVMVVLLEVDEMVNGVSSTVTERVNREYPCAYHVAASTF